MLSRTKTFRVRLLSRCIYDQRCRSPQLVLAVTIAEKGSAYVELTHALPRALLCLLRLVRLPPGSAIMRGETVGVAASLSAASLAKRSSRNRVVFRTIASYSRSFSCLRLAARIIDWNNNDSAEVRRPRPPTSRPQGKPPFGARGQSTKNLHSQAVKVFHLAMQQCLRAATSAWVALNHCN